MALRREFNEVGIGEEWEPVLDRPLTPIEQTLLDRVLERLEPVEFEPWWVSSQLRPGRQVPMPTGGLGGV